MLTITAQPVPPRMDADGVVRVGGTRVALLAHLARDPVLAALIERHGPPRLRPPSEPGRFFGHLVDAIVSQQISVKAADAILGRVEARMDRAGITPAGILLAEAEGLRACGVSPQKCRYLLNLAQRVADGTLALEHLPGLEDEAVIQHLVQVKGIGRWTAQMFLIFALARPDVLPLDDLGFRSAIRRQYGLAELPTRAEIERLAELWQPYRTYAAWYLWRSLENT